MRWRVAAVGACLLLVLGLAATATGQQGRQSTPREEALAFTLSERDGQLVDARAQIVTTVRDLQATRAHRDALHDAALAACTESPEGRGEALSALCALAKTGQEDSGG